jgi:hypothetical protein
MAAIEGIVCGVAELSIEKPEEQGIHGCTV